MNKDIEIVLAELELEYVYLNAEMQLSTDRRSMPTRTALTRPNSETMVEVCNFDPIFKNF